jgi:molybdopterin biosynthesis enzyme
MGHSEVFGQREQARLQEAVTGKPGETRMIPARIEDGAAAGLGAGVESLVHANCLIVVPPDTATLEAGSKVTVVHLETQ